MKCHLLDLLEHQISTAQEDGEEFNTSLMNFEADGTRNSLLHFKHNQNGANQDVTNSWWHSAVEDRSWWSKSLACKNGMVQALKLKSW